MRRRALKLQVRRSCLKVFHFIIMHSSFLMRKLIPALFNHHENSCEITAIKLNEYIHNYNQSVQDFYLACAFLLPFQNFSRKTLPGLFKITLSSTQWIRVLCEFLSTQLSSDFTLKTKARPLSGAFFRADARVWQHSIVRRTQWKFTLCLLKQSFVLRMFTGRRSDTTSELLNSFLSLSRDEAFYAHPHKYPQKWFAKVFPRLFVCI